MHITLLMEQLSSGTINCNCKVAWGVHFQLRVNNQGLCAQATYLKACRLLGLAHIALPPPLSRFSAHSEMLHNTQVHSADEQIVNAMSSRG